MSTARHAHLTMISLGHMLAFFLHACGHVTFLHALIAVIGNECSIQLQPTIYPEKKVA